MRYDRTVLAYHGCDAGVADQLLLGKIRFIPSENPFDWLGRGVYFWEHGLDRALRFAHFQKARGKVTEPAVVGAIIQLGRCFDLLDTRFTAELPKAHASCEALYRARGEALPVNAGNIPDLKLRRLDCAVINLYLQRLDDLAPEPFQTVRAAFEEGPPAFPGSMIRAETHVQITVRDQRCILGVFRP